MSSFSSLGRGTIICYKKISEDNINIFKIFDSISSIQREGFPITKTIIKKNQDLCGYSWDTYENIEKRYPEDLAKYLVSIEKELEEDIELDIKKNAIELDIDSQVNLGVICCDPVDFSIIKVYDSLSDVVKDNFKKGYIYRLLTSESRFGAGYNWYWLHEWKRQDKLDEYYTKLAAGYNPRVKKSLIASKIQIVKCDIKDNILNIYRSIQEIDDFKVSGISKVLQKEIDDREYKNFHWYRLSEYVEKYPKRTDYIKKVAEIIEDEEEPMMKILLTISGKLISVNELYKARISYTSTGRPFPVLYKNPKAVDVSNQVRNQLLACDFKHLIPWLNRTKKYSISINFILKSGITRRDCANFEKIMCDDLTRFIKNDLGIEHFDDSEFYECQFVKSIIPNAKHEYAYIVLKESYYQERADVIEHPERIYLGGQFFPNIDWREKIEEEFKEAGLETYNPLSDIWSPEYRSFEKFKKCNTILYVLTPGDYTRKLSSEIINVTQNSYYYGDNQFIVVAVLGKPEDWGDSFNDIEFLENSTRHSNKTKFEYFNSTKDIVNYIKKLSV